jgi:hypothetical protein
MICVELDELREVRGPFLAFALGKGFGADSDQYHAHREVGQLNDGLLSGVKIRDFPVGEDDQDVVELVLLTHLFLPS